MGAARQAHRFGHTLQVVIHDDDVGCFHGGVGASAAHRKANVGLRQRRGIVDTVTGHARGAVALLQ